MPIAATKGLSRQKCFQIANGSNKGIEQTKVFSNCKWQQQKCAEIDKSSIKNRDKRERERERASSPRSDVARSWACTISEESSDMEVASIEPNLSIGLEFRPACWRLLVR